jgi:YidC/Oxa1 family membrane protein insertase
MTPVFANVLQPLIDCANWLLLRLHDDVGLDWGLSIIGLTVLVRLAIVPLTIKQIKSMNALRALQPQIKELQEKHKGDRQAMNQAMMRFYQENKVNPFSSCLPLLLQLPIFMSLFYLLRSNDFSRRVEDSGQQSFLFIHDLAAKAHGGELVVLMILFIGSQVASTMVMSVSVDKTQQRIMLLLPLFFAALIPNFPAGLILYWITTNFWTLGQQLVVRRLSPPPQPVLAAQGKPPRRTAKSGEGEQEKVPVGVGAGNGKAPPPPPRKKKRRRR